MYGKNAIRTIKTQKNHQKSGMPLRARKDLITFVLNCKP